MLASLVCGSEPSRLFWVRSVYLSHIKTELVRQHLSSDKMPFKGFDKLTFFVAWHTEHIL